MKRNQKNKGFTLVEMMVALAIFLALMAGVILVLFSGQDTWSNTETTIQVDEHLRAVLGKISQELRNSGDDVSGTLQIAINNGGGTGGSDILRFSIPIICQSGGGIIDNNGDVAYWGAPLSWGCSSSSCMDADNDCSTRDYKYIQYSINGVNQLVRAVLDTSFTILREDILAQNITDLQVGLSGDQNVATLTVTMQKLTHKNRPIINTSSLNVFLRNK